MLRLGQARSSPPGHAAAGLGAGSHAAVPYGKWDTGSRQRVPVACAALAGSGVGAASAVRISARQRTRQGFARKPKCRTRIKPFMVPEIVDLIPP